MDTYKIYPKHNRPALSRMRIQLVDPRLHVPHTHSITPRRCLHTNILHNYIYFLYNLQWLYVNLQFHNCPQKNQSVTAVPEYIRDAELRDICGTSLLLSQKGKKTYLQAKKMFWQQYSIKIASAGSLDPRPCI